MRRARRGNSRNKSAGCVLSAPGGCCVSPVCRGSNVGMLQTTLVNGDNFKPVTPARISVARNSYLAAFHATRIIYKILLYLPREVTKCPVLPARYFLRGRHTFSSRSRCPISLQLLHTTRDLRILYKKKFRMQLRINFALNLNRESPICNSILQIVLRYCFKSFLSGAIIIHGADISVFRIFTVFSSVNIAINSRSFSCFSRLSLVSLSESYASSLFTSRAISKNTCLRAVSDGAAARTKRHLKFLLPPILPENVAFRRRRDGCVCVWRSKRGN